MNVLAFEGGAVSFKGAHDHLRDFLEALRDNADHRPVALGVNWEDGDLWCEFTGDRIEPAYIAKATQ